MSDDRLRPLRHDELHDDGRALWERIVGTRGTQVITEDGHLAGPFNAWVHAPHVGVPALDLGSVLRFGTSLDPKVVEMATLTVAARWKAEFEWWAHSGLARRLGIPEPVIDAVNRGDIAEPGSDEQRLAHIVARQLVNDGHLDAPTFRAAQECFGDQGLIELVSLCGYYCMISFVLNAFDVPLPPGVPPTWPSEG